MMHLYSNAKRMGKNLQQIHVMHLIHMLNSSIRNYCHTFYKIDGKLGNIIYKLK